MLVYKASEAGIRCNVIPDETPDIAIGEKLVAAGKKLRKLKRALQENNNEYHQ
jgi:formylmethanofuran:tetrahydromethanopterin formyltransferase